MGLIPPVDDIIITEPGKVVGGIVIVLTDRGIVKLASGSPTAPIQTIVVTQPSTVQVTICDSAVNILLAMPPPIVTITVGLQPDVTLSVEGLGSRHGLTITDYPTSLTTLTLTPSTLTTIIIVNGPGVITNVLYPNAA